MLTPSGGYDRFKDECLSKIILFGDRFLRRVVSE
jgi:hypothetical protein